MPSLPKIIYWDSCVIIDYLDQNSIHLATLEAILEETSKSEGEIKIVTSQISKVEVAFGAAESKRQRLDDEVEKKLDDFWADDSVLAVIELHDGITTLARQLIRDGIPKGWKFKPIDAVHLATAKAYGVSEFHTYNLSDFKRYEEDMGFKICEPYAAQPKLI